MDRLDRIGFARLLVVLLLTCVAAPGRAVEIFDWTTNTEGSTAGGVDATMTGLVAPTRVNQNLSTIEYAAAPQSATQECLDYGINSDWSLALSEPVAALYLYVTFWRGPNAGPNPVTYQFDAPFSILSGLAEAGPGDETTLSLPGPNFHKGILVFPGPIQGLVMATDATLTNRSDVTFAVEPMPPATAPVDWAAPTDGSASGTVSGVDVTLTGIAQSASLLNTDLSGADFAIAPLAVDQETVSFDASDAWTLSLSAPTDALLLYAAFWRGNAAAANPVEYSFTAPFTVLSGFAEASVANAGMTLALPDTGFHNGLLLFHGPLAALTVASTAGTTSSQAMTVAIVPEPGAAASALVAVALLWRRRSAARR
jgi:hypothetical protein